MAVESGQIRHGQSLLEPVFYEPEGIDSHEIVRRVTRQAEGRVNWVTGAGGEATARIISRMYGRGYTGPLWEYLIR